MASAAQKILRPLSRLRRQLPLRRGAMGVRQCYRVRLPPLCKGRWVGRLRPSRWGCFFSGDLKLYRCVYCGCPTGSCRPNRKKRAGNARPYVIDFCSDYAVGATIGRPSCRFCRKRPLSRLLPLRRGAKGGRLPLRQRFATPQSAAPTAPLTQGSHRQYYSCTKRDIMTANSARVAPPRGSSRPPGLPVMMPFTFAQRIAGTA